MFTVDLRQTYPDTYSLGKFVGTELDVKDMFDSLLMTLLPSLPIDRTYRITDLARRPDLISARAYGTTDFAFWIMVYNGVINHEELETGVLLNLFKRKSFDTLVNRLGLLAGTDAQLAASPGKGRPNTNSFLTVV